MRYMDPYGPFGEEPALPERYSHKEAGSDSDAYDGCCDSRPRIPTHAESEASKVRDLPVGEGLAFRKQLDID